MSTRMAARAAGTALLALGALAPAAHAEDATVTSFDGTPIVTHWFPLPGLADGRTAPTVLMGPGWGGAGDVKVAGEGSPSTGTVGIATLHRAGYNVLTWDPRGFGRSGGTVEVDDPAYEGRDVQALLDWVAQQPAAELDGPGDPRVGMSGGSYGGGIQLVTAAIDPRVDAITPDIAWHSLGTSLYKDGIVKLGWAGLLYGSAASRPLDPHIRASYDEGVGSGVLSAANVRWYLDRGPGELVARITAPTLLLQGTVDTLFTLNEATTNYALLHAAGVPVKMLWFCGGHGVCLTKAGDTGRAAQATIAWLDRYVKRDASVDTGPAVDLVDQDGRRMTAAGWPLPAAGSLRATGRGVLHLTKAGGAGPATIAARAGGLGPAVAGITPARARNAVNVRIRAGRRGATVVGAPKVTLVYRGRAGNGNRPQRVFAQLVDDATGRVLGNQITPIPLRLDGRRHTVTRPLEVVAHTLKGRGAVTLQLVATTVAYGQPRLGGRVRFDRVRVALPVVR